MCKPLIFWQEPGLPDALVEVNWHWKDSTNLHHDCQKWKVSTRWKSGHVEHFTRPCIVHMLKSYNLRQWLSVMVFVLFGQLDCHFPIWVCLSCSQKIAGHPGTHAMTGSRTLETHAATSTHWANGRLHMAMGAQCLSGLGKWGPGHLALYQCQGVPGHPRHR